jgi:DNA-binding NtrC family response regulator
MRHGRVVPHWGTRDRDWGSIRKWLTLTPLRDRNATIELVMSDIAMPGGMSGLELARTLREHRPELPVVMATGYGQYALQVVKEGFALVEKPYRRDVLAASLRAAVERGRRAESAAKPVKPSLDPARSPIARLGPGNLGGPSG